MSILGTIAAISAGGSLLSSGIGALSSNRNANKSIAAQERENEKNRQFNKQQAEQQNKWNIEQWNRENAYNTPQEQMKRLQQAGLNPDLIYGNGTLQNVAASSPGMAASQHDSIPDYSALAQKKTLGSVMQDALMMRQMQATLDNIKADTNKKESETTGQNIANKWQDLINQTDLQFKNLNITLAEKDVILKDIDAKKGYKELEELDTNIQYTKQKITESASQVAEINERALDLRLFRTLRGKQLRQQVRLLSAQANESEKTLLPKLQQFAQELLKSNAQTAQLELGNQRITMENGILQIDYNNATNGVNKKLSKIKATTGLTLDIVNNAIDILFAPAKPILDAVGGVSRAVK